MALSPGTRLGAYEILSLLGSGGMGEVYRAHDAKLNRDVAIKVLLQAVANDPERLARFSREAQILASLNHQNIGHIYGLEDAGSVRALVMELVEGPTLADRIAQGAVPLTEALAIAKQVAEALEAAHEQGIIHRDLKPANIKVRADGTVKVLDFGLAKAIAGDGSGVDLTKSPTITVVGTRDGMLLGTAAYMSPEQTRGKPLDKRTDIWSFGCVLYELFAGRCAFAGETVSDTIVSILEREPGWTAVPVTTPTNVRRLLQRCLEKDPRHRLRDIGDARIELDDALKSRAPTSSPLAGLGFLDGRSQTAADLELQAAKMAAEDVSLRGDVTRRTRRRSVRLWVVVVGLTLIGLALAAWRLQVTSGSPQEVRFSVSIPDNTTLDSGPTLSSDGRRLVFGALPDNKNYRQAPLWVRRFDALGAEPLLGTEGAQLPFWSPSSRFIGFFMLGKLQKVDASGGSLQTLCDVPRNQEAGGTWSPNGMIVFAQDGKGGGLFRVSDTGGPATRFATAPANVSYRYPEFLPDGRHFVVVAHREPPETSDVHVGSLDSADTRLLLHGPERVQYAPPGYLLFARSRALMAQQFDATRLGLVGDAVPIAAGNGIDSESFSTSQTGVLAYRSAPISPSRLTWVDRTGTVLGVIETPEQAHNPWFSPDDTRLLFDENRAYGSSERDIWIFEVSRQVLTRVTFAGADRAIWSPDGKQIVFQSHRGGVGHLYEHAASGAGEDKLLPTSEDFRAIDWSPDGRFIVGAHFGPKGQNETWLLPQFGDLKPFPLLRGGDFTASQAHVSPDSRWIAYASDESGGWEIYVQPFPTGGDKVRVSPNGGAQPAWRRDGKELFYLTPDKKLMAVLVNTGSGTFQAGTPHLLFQTRITLGISNGRNHYAVTGDGQRFVVIVPDAKGANSTIQVVLNWSEELKQRVTTR